MSLFLPNILWTTKKRTRENKSRDHELKYSFGKFKARMQGNAADAKIRANNNLGRFEERQSELDRKLGELKDAGQDRWIDIKNNLDDMVRDMRDSLRKLG
jgi:hypothetical protein